MKTLLTILRGLLALPGIISGLWHRVTLRRLDRAQDEAETQERRAATAEAVNVQRERADAASAAAKQEGDAMVEDVRQRARSGRRDHFERGMRGKD